MTTDHIRPYVVCGDYKYGMVVFPRPSRRRLSPSHGAGSFSSGSAVNFGTNISPSGFIVTGVARLGDSALTAIGAGKFVGLENATDKAAAKGKSLRRQLTRAAGQRAEPQIQPEGAEDDSGRRAGDNERLGTRADHRRQREDEAIGGTGVDHRGHGATTRTAGLAAGRFSLAITPSKKLPPTSEEFLRTKEQEIAEREKKISQFTDIELRQLWESGGMATVLRFDIFWDQ